MKNSIAYRLRIFIGIIFVLSGLLKATNTAAFADLMSQYGETWFGFGAPVIIFTELLLGLSLIFDLYPKWATWISATFLVIVTLIYTYGITAEGITNCGCFGPLTWLNSKPWITFTRNACLLALLIPTIIYPPNKNLKPSIFTIIFMAIIATAVMFMCGFSMHGAKCTQKRPTTFQPYALPSSPLSKYISCNQDSTYLIFAFSYSCPYCQNSIGNVNQYTQMGYVDRVIGLTIEDSVAQERFNRLFDVNFEIHELSSLQMYQLTNTLPTCFIIRNDSIVSKYTGLVISPALLIPLNNQNIHDHVITHHVIPIPQTKVALFLFPPSSNPPPKTPQMHQGD